MLDFVFRDFGNARFRLETLRMRDFVFRDFGNARFRV